MSRYPRLREEVERIVTQQIAEREQSCKEHIIKLNESELAYMNTKHEDFVGFGSNSNSSSSGNSSGGGYQSTSTENLTISEGLNKLGNQVIRRGWMCIFNLGVMKGRSRSYWFVLTSESLSWFKDEEEKHKKYMLPLDDLKLRDAAAQRFRSRRHSLSLFHPDMKSNVFKNYKQLDLSCETHDDAEAWKTCLLRAGVYQEKVFDPDSDDEQSSVDNSNFIDPQLKRQVTVFNVFFYS